jgi:hypothetical protein
LISAADEERHEEVETPVEGLPSSGQSDPSYGLASLYLATFSFFLFFTPTLLSGMTGALGASIAFFAGIFVSSGCFLFCWHGSKLAQRALECPGHQGYAQAGLLVNKFFLKFYAAGVIFFLIGAVVTLVYAKNYSNQLQDSLKGLDSFKGFEKLLNP